MIVRLQGRENSTIERLEEVCGVAREVEDHHAAYPGVIHKVNAHVGRVLIKNKKAPLFLILRGCLWQIHLPESTESDIVVGPACGRVVVLPVRQFRRKPLCLESVTGIDNDGGKPLAYSGDGFKNGDLRR